MGVQIRRAYEAPSVSDGYRVLIDRLWPRGVGREAAQLDEWAREDKLHELRARAERRTLTLVYGARDTEHNDAVVLAEILRGDERAG